MPLESGFSLFIGSISNSLAKVSIDRDYGPSFLARNVRAALDTETIRLATPPPLSHIFQNKTKTNERNERLMASRSLENWYPKSAEIDHVNRETVLRILPKAINAEGSSIDVNNGTPGVSEPAWLPQTGSTRFACSISCIVSQEVKGKQITIQHQVTHAILVNQSSAQGSISFRIDMKDPFLLSETDLTRLEIDRGLRSTTSTETIDSDHYLIRILIKAKPDASNRDLHHLLGDLSVHSKESSIRASIKGLSHYKFAETSFDLSTTSNKTARLPYKLVVERSWLSVRDSTLATINKRKLGYDKTHIEPPLRASKHKITYIYPGTLNETRSCIRTDLACMFCIGRHPHSTFERLQLHYTLNHPYLNFSSFGPEIKDGVSHWRLHVDLEGPKKQRASNDVPDEREMAWIRPSRPFDIRNYLKGDESWMTGTRNNSGPIPDSETNPLPRNDPARAHLPSQVQQIQSRKRKRWHVPAIPGTVLYATTSKRRLEPGELLSESDDVSTDGESWAARKEQLRAPSILGSSGGEFFRLFDAHIHRERLSGDLFLRDAIVRFTRKYRQHLRRPLLQADFRLKLLQLLKSGLIPRETHDYCVAQTDPSNITDSGTGDDRLEPVLHPLTLHPRVKRLLGQVAYHPTIQQRLSHFLTDPTTKTEVLDIAAKMRPRTGDDPDAIVANAAFMKDELPKWLDELRWAKPVHVTDGTCVCGVPAGVADFIYCADPQCRREAFHLECVGLRRNRSDWRCARCAGRETEWGG